MTNATPTPAVDAAAAAPADPAERSIAIDAVRGLAVLGILAMNVVEFGLPIRAYGDPRAAGGDQGLDLWTWLLQQALFDGRMRALFSLLFGAGLVLIDERLRRGGRGADAADLLLRRCLWLTAFGIVHRFALQWTGDILYMYGLLGLIAIACRRLRLRTQAIAGLLCLLAAVPIEAWHHHQAAKLRDDAAAAAQLERDGQPIPDALQQARSRWERRNAPPRAADNDAEIAAMRSGYAQVFAWRWDYHHTFQSAYLYYYFVWDVLGMMLLGMALGRSGFFAGRWPAGRYGATVLVGAAAAALSFWSSWLQQRGGFAGDDLALHTAQQMSYPLLRLCGGLGWAALLLLLVRNGRARAIAAPLTAVGRMAFTNYVLQTVCCTLLFFGYGLGMYGRFARHELVCVWLAVSLLQVAVSMTWLRWFRFGPLEWAWRSLTWWQRQPLRRRAPPFA